MQTTIAQNSLPKPTQTTGLRAIHYQNARIIFKVPRGNTFYGETHRSHRSTVRRLVILAAPKDPYDVLDISTAATMNEIKKAYRKKALKLHPDVNKAPDARERFMECKAAYQDIINRKQTTKKSPYSNRNSFRNRPPSTGSTYRTPSPPPQQQEEFYDLGMINCFCSIITCCTFTYNQNHSFPPTCFRRSFS